MAIIEKISKLKDFGIFSDFLWNNELTPFRKFNLIYGWNRTGKTTISRIFSSCEKKLSYDNAKFKQYPEKGTFEITTSDNTIIKNSNIENCPLSVRVFNQDFVDENISFESSNLYNPIVVYVGEENIQHKIKLADLKERKNILNKEYNQAKIHTQDKYKIDDNFRISTAQTITQILTDKKSRDRYYSYDKSKVKEKIDQIGSNSLSNSLLSDADKNKLEEIIRTSAKSKQDDLPNYKFPIFNIDMEITSFNEIFLAAQKLLRKKISSDIIDRLKNDSELNNWIKKGFDLHKSKREKEKCLFCQNTLGIDFLSSLSNHFSKDYEELQINIATLITEIKKLKQNLVDIQNNELYPDLRDKYKTEAKELNAVITITNQWVDQIIGHLTEKYNNPLINIDITEKPNDFLELYNNKINALNGIIREQNDKITKHAEEVNSSKETLELHLIATAIHEQNYKLIIDESSNSKINEDEIKKKLDSITKEAELIENEISNIGNAILKINSHLTAFFGKDEIQLELNNEKNAYLIKRNGNLAKNLSEGEKTAIAFSYFIVKTEERDFNINKGIIFIDDPISSLDSNFTYHCFSLIQHHFKDAEQLFISTHNFQLFNLAKNWLLRKNKQRVAQGKNELCEFYMIENYLSSAQRQASLVGLDTTLRNFNSEYHFLFALLYKFKNKNIEYADLYTIGNIARRCFDIFADFKIPALMDQKQKLDKLIEIINSKNEDITVTEAHKIYNLMNDFSHNSDQASVIEHKQKNEILEAITVLLKIIEKSDPTHFKLLEKAL